MKLINNAGTVIKNLLSAVSVVVKSLREAQYETLNDLQQPAQQLNISANKMASSVKTLPFKRAAKAAYLKSSAKYDRPRGSSGGCAIRVRRDGIMLLQSPRSVSWAVCAVTHRPVYNGCSHKRR